MRVAAGALVHALGPEHRAAAMRAFDDDQRRWIEYRPRPRPGVSLGATGGAARKAAHRLLATGLSPHAYAQAMAVLALEEVLDRQEGWRRGRHSDDYRTVIFGEPGGERWAWRFEGHHLSVTMTVVDGAVSPAPVFLGANPARVTYGGRTVLRPLAPEEDLGRELLSALSPTHRARAVLSDEVPADIRSGVLATVEEALRPAGVPARDLGGAARGLLDRLVALYLDRLPAELAARESARMDRRDLHFAWEGPPDEGRRHYYRLQGPDLLIEYDNTSDDGNHAHTVLRRPAGDFGADVLAEHRRRAAH